jgi:hypothetical protein
MCRKSAISGVKLRVWEEFFPSVGKQYLVRTFLVTDEGLPDTREDKQRVKKGV